MRTLTALLLIICSTNASALTCSVKVLKASCWGNYDVTIPMHFSSNAGSRRTVVLAKKTAKDAAKFEALVTMPCKKGDQLLYSAKFSPPIWDGGKESPDILASQKIGVILGLPDTVKDYKLDICFPRDFMEVPYPMEYNTKCKCPERPKVSKKDKGYDKVKKKK